MYWLGEGGADQFRRSLAVWPESLRKPLKPYDSECLCKPPIFADCFTLPGRVSDAFMHSRWHFSTTANCALSGRHCLTEPLNRMLSGGAWPTRRYSSGEDGNQIGLEATNEEGNEEEQQGSRE